MCLTQSATPRKQNVGSHSGHNIVDHHPRKPMIHLRVVLFRQGSGQAADLLSGSRLKLIGLHHSALGLGHPSGLGDLCRASGFSWGSLGEFQIPNLYLSGSCLNMDAKIKKS